jgi:hypothetical protein
MRQCGSSTGAAAKEEPYGAIMLVVDAATAALEADFSSAAERELNEPPWTSVPRLLTSEIQTGVRAEFRIHQ